LGKPLIIVESPAKAKTITKFLGKGFVVESSIGHVRDLPSTADEIPPAYKGKPWARTGVDVENGFKPLYIVPPEKRAHVKKLKDLVADASELYLATDEDREGEAIAWHLREVLAPKVPVRRMVFHEITERAIKKALAEPRSIDDKLVDAQEARRILDRLYGYEVSPVLWKKVAPRLSAGRVQSVATRLVVERERARLAFHAASYASVSATLEAASPPLVGAELVELGGKRVAKGGDFDPLTGSLSEAAKKAGVLVLDPSRAKAVAAKIAPSAGKGAAARVLEVTRKPFTQRPYPPFITSTLQQEAARKLRFGAQRTMRVAQSLYENGYITYMRTDSTTLSGEALRAARTQVAELFGKEYVPAEPRTYSKQVKGAQEAHEAIRPAGEVFRTPDEVRGELGDDAFRLYELVWKRTVASQMKDATGERTSVRIGVSLGEVASPSGEAVLSATGRVLHFAGFLRAYVEGSDDPEAELEDREKALPALREGDVLTARAAEAREHATQPPARFTEASLVKELEDRGIGRPSTYASIIQTIQDRGYVFKKGTALVPTFTAFAVVNLLEKHFGELVDYAFTARMEDDLDAISSGERESTPWLHSFYFGAPKKAPKAPKASKGAAASEASDHTPDIGLKDRIGSGVELIDAREVCSLSLGRTSEGEVFARVGRYGPYVQLEGSERRANIPTDLPPDELTLDKAAALLSQADAGNRSLGEGPGGEPIFVKTGRYGPYVQLGEAEMTKAKGKDKAKEKETKPRMASLWPGMSVETLTVEQARLLLSFPKVLGTHPRTGADVVAADGQYGPYLSTEVDGKREYRSLANHAELASITLGEAVAKLDQPREFRGRGRSQSSLAELGPSPVTSKPIQVKKGQFGVYVTDGQVNATVPKGVDPTTLTLAQALELIAAREDRLRSQGQDPRADKAGAKKAPSRAAKTATKTAASGESAPASKGSTRKASAAKVPTKKAATSAKPAKKAAPKKVATKAAKGP
jgi:DNA topoisomerase-1